jgi:hypothetical protein
MHVAIVGVDLLGQARIRDAATRLGATVSLHPGPGIPEADVVVVDLETLDPSGLVPPPPSVRVLGIYPHKDTDLAARAERAGIEPVPRNRFVRELDALLQGDRGRA